MAEYLSEYKIKIFFNNFNNRVVKTVDLKDNVFNDHRDIFKLLFKPLRDIGYFKEFELKLNTLVWKNEVDFAPEYLYQLTNCDGF